MSEYNVVDNTELVELIEQGLKKGYWDKALIPELKKRFKKLELYKRLFNICKEYKDTSIGLSYDSEFLNVMSELEEGLKNEK